MIVKGSRVRLLPFYDLPEQFGVVIDIGTPQNACMTVRLDDKYIDEGIFDDGLREVPVVQLEEA